MIDLGPIYLAVTGALLFVALALGFRVLREIVREGRDRRRRRRAGDLERYAEDEEFGRGPPAGPDDDSETADNPHAPADRNCPDATCPQCGAANDPEFSYCRRCAAPLRLGA